jgi:hypothetical protein
VKIADQPVRSLSRGLALGGTLDFAGGPKKSVILRLEDMSTVRVSSGRGAPEAAFSADGVGEALGRCTEYALILPTHHAGNPSDNTVARDQFDPSSLIPPRQFHKYPIGGGIVIEIFGYIR